MRETLTKLVSVLGMMGSAHDGEILNSARLAERLRKQMNRSWSDLILHSSSSSSSSDKLELWRGRAEKAEAAVLRLESQMKELEQEIKNLRAGKDFKLDHKTEHKLVELMRRQLVTDDTIYQITGWPPAPDLHTALSAIADKHGLSLQRIGKRISGLYRFRAPT